MFKGPQNGQRRKAYCLKKTHQKGRNKRWDGRRVGWVSRMEGTGGWGEQMKIYQHILCALGVKLCPPDRLKSEPLPTRAYNGLWKRGHCRCELSEDEIRTEKSMVYNLVWVQVATRLEWCNCKPVNAWDNQKLEEVIKEQFPEGIGGVMALLTPWVQTCNLQNSGRLCFKT